MRKDELNALDALHDTYESEFKQVAREHLREYADAVTSPVPRFGPNAYICPCCGSGSGKNGHYTPAFYLFRTKDGELRFKCHSCDATGDIFKLASFVNHTKGARESLRIVADFLGVDLAKRSPLSEIRVNDTSIEQPRSSRDILKLKQEAHAYISNSQRHIQETRYFHTRGLTDETIARFRLGYDPEKRLAIIPFTSTYYIGRSIVVDVDEKGAGKHYKPAGLRQPIFNLAALSESKDPVFLTEAPLDAISLMQVGGTAMALGGTSVSILKTILDAYHLRNPFILAFDQDGPGRRLSKTVTLLLEERDVPFTQAEHPDLINYKDANAALLASPVALQRAVEAETERAQRTSLSLKSSGRAESEGQETVSLAASGRLRSSQASR